MKRKKIISQKEAYLQAINLAVGSLCGACMIWIAFRMISQMIASLPWSVFWIAEGVWMLATFVVLLLWQFGKIDLAPISEVDDA